MLRIKNAFVIIVLVVLELCKSNICVVNALSGSKVDHLPGFQHSGTFPFDIETGYIGVGQEEEVQLFYYFVKSQTDHKTDPLMFWIPGGPGCSVLYGLTVQNGPTKFDMKKELINGSLPTMPLNPYSWTKVANFLYIDLPMRTGFSYATTERANHSDPIQAGELAHQFVLKWLMNHPEFLTNDLYVGGGSYSGIFVPIITHMISKGNEEGIKPWINLKGYLLGNPRTYEQLENGYWATFSYHMGLIPIELYETMKQHCRDHYESDADPSHEICKRNTLTFTKMVEEISWPNILYPPCSRASEPSVESNGQRRSLSEMPRLPPGALCLEGWFSEAIERWANNDTVREALHVRKGTVGPIKACSPDFTHGTTFKRTITNVVPYHANLTVKGYRALIFSGDHDMEVPSIATEKWIKSLNYSIVDQWRPWIIDGLVAGYTRSYANNMTFATVKGSGHDVQLYNPSEAFVMFKRWITGNKL